MKLTMAALLMVGWAVGCGTVTDPVPVDTFCREYSLTVCAAERGCGRDCEPVPAENRCLAALACLLEVDFWAPCFDAAAEYSADNCRDPLVISAACPFDLCE